MAYKKIEISNCNFCPACKSVKGVIFRKSVQVKYTACWGKGLKEFKPEELPSISFITTTVKCADCFKSFTII